MEPTHRHPIKAMDPRILLAQAFLLVVMVMTSASWPALATLFALFLALTRWMETLGDFWRWVRWVLPMVGFFGLVTSWAFTWEAGLMAGVRLLGITWAGHLFFRSTTPEHMANALVKSGLPYAAAFVVSAGMQFVTVLARKAKEVLEAQQSRGIPITIGWRTAKYLPAFFTPLLVQSFQLAEELAEAMEARGFGRQGRSFYTQYRIKPKDWIALVIGVVITALWTIGQYHWL